MAEKSVNAGRKNFIMLLLTLVQKKAGEKGRECRKEETVLHISRVFDWKTAQ